MLQNIITACPSDSLVGMVSSIIHDGAVLSGWSDGRYAIMLFGVLLPMAAILLLCAASLALTRHRLSRVIAIICLALGCIALTGFIALVVYAMVFGTTWARS